MNQPTEATDDLGWRTVSSPHFLIGVALAGRRRSWSRSRSSGRRLGRGRIRRGSCPVPRVNPRTGRKTKYLGHIVPDIGAPGLDRPEEFRGIKEAILEAYRRRCFDKDTARGELLLLYRLTFPRRNRKAAGIPAAERRQLRKEIREAMKKL